VKLVKKNFGFDPDKYFVIPDDVIYVAKPVLRHRIILTPEKEMEGISEDEIIEKVIHSIEVPR